MISIIIVNFNGKKWLDKLFNSLKEQTYTNFEVILVDNASKDASLEYVKQNFSWVYTISLKKNIGFAGGNNEGISQAKGEYILLLNSDTWVEADFLEKLWLSYQNNEVDVISALESDYNGSQVNSGQNTIDFLGHPVRQPLNSKKHFFLSGACLFFSHDLYDNTGGLDTDFFMYFEEIDWFWRLHLLKKKIYLDKNISFYHAGSGSSNSNILRREMFLWRNNNCLNMLIKNYQLNNLFWVLPLYFAINFIEMLVFLLILRPTIAYTYIQGLFYNIKMLPKTLEKRKNIQKTRKISDKSIFQLMYIGSGKLVHLYERIKNAKTY